MAGASSSSRLEFKFNPVVNGRASWFLSQKGAVESNGLALGEDVVFVENIVEAVAREKNLVLVIARNQRLSARLINAMASEDVLILQTSKASAAELVRAINRVRSQAAIAWKRSQLAADGREHLFRTVSCPECQAAIDQSELPSTSHVYCEFCDCVFGPGGVVTNGATYAICEKCELFDRVRYYSEVYIVFLLVFAAWETRRPRLCDRCAHSVFLQMLLKNTLFLVGIPFTAALKLKSMSGRTALTKGLMAANKLVGKGRSTEAVHRFADLHRQLPNHPGLLFNEGIGHVKGGNRAEARACFERSLRACNNYLPASVMSERLDSVNMRG